MIRINQLKLPIGHGKSELLTKAATILKISREEIKELTIVKQSVDARKKEAILYSYTVDVQLQREAEVLHRNKNVNVMSVKKETYCFPPSGSKVLKERPLIIGAGPAGLFCGLMLARAGYAPILLDRGEEIDKRKQTVDHFWSGGSLNLNSNVAFGEGGAGTFSDGKLNTLVKDSCKRNEKVMEILVEFGADPSIRYQNKPHIGTDVLSEIVKHIRQEIIRLGGEVHFLSHVTDFLIENQRLKGVVVNAEKRIETEIVILAVGHSARDTFEVLWNRGVPMQQKAFAVGLRIQHTQKMINLSQYGRQGAEILGAADYKLSYQSKHGRGVYSFCMCPGGYVVNASSEENCLAINGMSNHARDAENANSALIVTVTPEDYPDQTPLAGIAYQRKLEKLAYKYGEGKIPIQLYGDFKAGKESTEFGAIQPQMKGAYHFANLHRMLPGYLSQSLIEGVETFGKMIKGFQHHDAILAGIESRTSSPLRIDRDSIYESRVKGLFPCGEGAGYAGGITSAAMDGIKVAEEIASRFSPIN